MSMDNEDYERRKQRALRRLGCSEPKCGMCGEDRWQTLEAHHVAGKAYDAVTTVVLCRNCHRVASDAQHDHPPAQDCADPALEAIGRFLLGLADLLKIAVERLIEYGRALIARAQGGGARECAT